MPCVHRCVPRTWLPRARLPLPVKIGSLIPLTQCHPTKRPPMEENPANRDKLVQDMRVVISDAEDLLRATANQAGEKIAVARERIQDSLHQAKVKLAEAEALVTERAKQAARYTDEYVHENPWRAIGVAAGIGLVLGLLMSRR